MPKIGRDRKEGWGLMHGNCISQGSKENSVLGCMPDPYSVTFSTNKRDSSLLCYYKEE